MFFYVCVWNSYLSTIPTVLTEVYRKSLNAIKHTIQDTLKEHQSLIINLN